MKRRIDTDLRSAVSSLEQMVLQELGPDEVLAKSLKQLLRLMRCPYGFYYRCDATEDLTNIPWQFGGAWVISNTKSEPILQSALSTSSHVPTEMLQDMLIGRCWYYNPDEELDFPMPTSHPSINNMLCIPLTDTRNVYGLLCICNHPQEFSPECFKRLRPFTTAANCLLRASMRSNRFQSFNPGPIQTTEIPVYFEKLLDSMFNAIVVVDQYNMISSANKAAASMLAATKSQIIGQGLAKFLPKGANANLRDCDPTKTEDDSTRRTWRGVSVFTLEGKKHLVDLREFEIPGVQAHKLLLMDDISERIESRVNHQQTLQQFQVLTNLAPVGIVQIDENWNCTYTNDTWCRYCQLTPEEALGQGWLTALHHSDADTFLSELTTSSTTTGQYSGEFRLMSPLGHVTWTQVNACSLYNERGNVTGLIMTFNDITQHLKTEKHLKNIAEKDQLTGLINRAFFNDRIENALKGIDRYGSVAVMFIDLDEFKHINDTLGHDVGDELLVEVSKRLTLSVRNADTIARIGGDEFTILLTNVHNTHSITFVADKLIETLSAPFTLSDRPVYVSASIGIAVANDKNAGVKHLLKQADIALYKAKEAGRNQYKFYTKELDNDAKLHILLRQSLKEVGRNDFSVVYQPQVDAETQKITGVEALTRWNHKEAEPTSPDKFIKMIEDSGLINEFSDWLLNQVFREYSHWRKASADFDHVSLSINLSAKQFRNKSLAEDIQCLSIKYNVPAYCVVLEVTETVLIEDTAVANHILTKMKDFGFKLSLDDFGTGYSSLAYLRSMPFDYLKIDKSFIQNVTKFDEDAKIVAAILKLSESLNLRVVAEGVDNAEVGQWLIEHDCPIHQGFFYHKPISGLKLNHLLHINSKINAA